MSYFKGESAHNPTSANRMAAAPKVQNTTRRNGLLTAAMNVMPSANIHSMLVTP